MNLVWHQLRKDLRQHWVLTAIWLVAIAIQTVIYLMSLQVKFTNWQGSHDWSDWMMVLFLLKGLLLFVSVPSLIQSESLVGTTPFWLTRPMPRLTVLQAKVIYIVVIWLLPALIPEVAAFVYFGVPWRDTLLMVPELLLYWGTFLMALTLLSGLTPNFGRFALWIFGGVVGFYLLMFLIEVIFSPLFRHAGEVAHAREDGGVTSGLISMLLTILGGAGLTIYHYYKRRTGWFTSGFFVLILVSCTTWWWWHWDIIKALKTEAEGQVIAARGGGPMLSEEVSVRVESDKVSVSESRIVVNTKIVTAQQISFTTEIRGANPTIGYLLEWIATQLYEKDVMVWEGDKRQSCQNNLRETFLNQQALAPLLPGTRLLNVPENQNGNRNLSAYFVEMPDTDFEIWKNKKLTMKADLDLTAVRYAKYWELPLKKRASWREGARQVMVMDLLYRTQGCTVMLSSVRTDLLFDLSSKEVVSRPLSRFYVLYNVKRGEAVVQDDINDYSMNEEFYSSSGSGKLDVKYKELGFTGKRSDGTAGAANLSRDWFRDAILICVDAEKIGSVSKMIVVPDVVFERAKE